MSDKTLYAAHPLWQPACTHQCAWQIASAHNGRLSSL